MRLGKDIIVFETNEKETPIRLIIDGSHNIDLEIDEILDLRDLCQKIITNVIFPYPSND